jgi:hypothetical protein
VPDFVFCSPGICQDGGGDSAPNCSNGASISAGDEFPTTVIPAIQATAWYKAGGIIILTYEEGDGGGQGQFLHGSGNHVPTTVISTAIKGAAQCTSYVNHRVVSSAGSSRPTACPTWATPPLPRPTAGCRCRNRRVLWWVVSIRRGRLRSGSEGRLQAGS